MPADKHLTRAHDDDLTISDESDAGTAESASLDAGIAIGARHNTRIQLAAALFAVLALVAALYLARGFFVPLLIGILGSYALHPLVDWLEQWRLPRSIGAALVLVSVVGGVSWIGVSMSDDAVALIEKLPEAARKLRSDLSLSRSGAPTALQNMQEAAHEIQGAAADASAQAAGGKAAKDRSTSTGAGDAAPRAYSAISTERPGRPAPRAVAAQAPEPTWLLDYTLAQSALLATVAAQAPVVLLLTYFLLASGLHFRRKLVKLVGPSLSRKKDAVRILEEIDVQIQRYLLANLATNTLLAVGTWLAFLALGLDQAGVWGVAAGVLHFIPYLGPALIAFGSGVAAFLQFGSVLYAVTVAVVSLLVAGTIGFAFMTWLQSRFARVNAAVLFIALLFFGWLWGVWGLLLGAPLVAIAKVVFDRVESLKPMGELLGR
jgi:predicted PurR-regulated permease PerM